MSSFRGYSDSKTTSVPALLRCDLTGPRYYIYTSQLHRGVAFIEENSSSRHRVIQSCWQGTDLAWIWEGYGKLVCEPCVERRNGIGEAKNGKMCCRCV